MNKPTTIVLVEDDASFAKAVEASLAKYPNYLIIKTFSLSEAFRILSEIKKGERGAEDSVVVLLDLNLPDSSGMSTFTSLKEHCGGVPLIILSGKDDEQLALNAIEQGAQDYLVKGDIKGSDLARSITYAIERAKLLADREDFVATLTHDLKGPLFGANRILSLFIDEKFGPIASEQKELLSRLQCSNVRLLEMISNLLEVYRFEKNPNSMDFARVRLSEIVQACLDEVVLLAEDKAIQIRFEPDSDSDYPVRAEAFSIARVIRNLLDNAIKYTPRGGEVSLRLSRNNGTVAVQIGDTGPGIAEADRQYLFRRFFRGASGQGYSRSTGLGLYLCKQIMQYHSGTIEFRPNPGGGSLFVLELPALKEGQH